MDEKRLSAYMNDHLAGSIAAVDMGETGMKENRGTPLGDFLARLVEEIGEDKGTLEDLIEIVGGKKDPAKRVAGWMAEKMNRLRVAGSKSADMRRLEELEILLVGIRGKLALWVALDEIRSVDERLREFDFRSLQERAQRQMDELETHRIEAVRQAFLRK